MSYEWDEWRRVIVPLKSKIVLEDIKKMAALFRGEYQGEDVQLGQKVYNFDFDGKAGAEIFKKELSKRFGKWLNPGVRSYTDGEYD